MTTRVLTTNEGPDKVVVTHCGQKRVLEKGETCANYVYPDAPITITEEIANGQSEQTPRV